MKTLPQNVFVSAGTNWAFFWRIRVLRLCERRSSVAGDAVIDDGLGSLPQIDSEDSNGLQCGQRFRNQAWFGRQRHVSTRFLWLQDNVSKGELKVVKVGTTDQLADFLTKPVTARWLAEKSPELGLEFRCGRSPLQRGLVS